MKKFGYAVPGTSASAAAKAGAVSGRPARGAVRIRDWRVPVCRVPNRSARVVMASGPGGRLTP